MTVLKAAVVGDVGDTRVLTLDGISSLSAVTAIEAHVWAAGVDPVTLAATVTDADECEVTVELGDDDGWLATTAIARSYWFEVQATFGATVLTWPNGKPATLSVREQGD